MSTFFSKNETVSKNDNMIANLIKNGTSITGDISAQSDLRIDGKIAGNIQCVAKVVIGSSAQILGNIKCNDLTIEGKVKGNIEVGGVLCFKANADFEGDVKYKKLVVEEGANITGSLTNTTSVVKPVNTAATVSTTTHNGQTTAVAQ
jgi:cytoskeletal protein CcmA (bactofilin family)